MKDEEVERIGYMNHLIKIKEQSCNSHLSEKSWESEDENCSFPPLPPCSMKLLKLERLFWTRKDEPSH